MPKSGAVVNINKLLQDIDEDDSSCNGSDCICENHFNNNHGKLSPSRDLEDSQITALEEMEDDSSLEASSYYEFELEEVKGIRDRNEPRKIMLSIRDITQVVIC